MKVLVFFIYFELLFRWGESPYQLALKHTHSQIALYLKEHGGSRLLNSEVTIKKLLLSIIYI